jgi:hypothetical protein
MQYDKLQDALRSARVQLEQAYIDQESIRRRLWECQDDLKFMSGLFYVTGAMLALVVTLRFIHLLG